MQTLIWAFGAMLVLMLIITLLPIGFSFRGKFFVVLAGFVLALVGLAAAASFPLWQTALMVFLLVLVAAYIMDRRIGTVMYNQVKESFDIELEEEFDTVITGNNTRNATDSALMNLNEIETDLPALINLDKKEDFHILEEPQIVVGNAQDIDSVDNSLLDVFIEDEINKTEQEIKPDLGHLSDIENLLLEESKEKIDSEDEGWLKEFNDLTAETEVEPPVSIKIEDYELDELFPAVKEAAAGVEENLIDNTELDAGYLSDIETLLLEESEDKNESEDEGWLEELNADDLTQVTEQEEPVTVALEDNELDELFMAVKEVAANENVILKESNLKKEVSLQK